MRKYGSNFAREATDTEFGLYELAAKAFEITRAKVEELHEKGLVGDRILGVFQALATGGGVEVTKVEFGDQAETVAINFNSTELGIQQGRLSYQPYELNAQGEATESSFPIMLAVNGFLSNANATLEETPLNFQIYVPALAQRFEEGPDGEGLSRDFISVSVADSRDYQPGIFTRNPDELEPVIGPVAVAKVKTALDTARTEHEHSIPRCHIGRVEVYANPEPTEGLEKQGCWATYTVKALGGTVTVPYNLAGEVLNYRI